MRRNTLPKIASRFSGARDNIPPAVPRRLVIALAMLLACTARERDAATVESTTTPPPTSEPERAPLVTIELGLVGPDALALLAERHGPDSPLVRADKLLIVHHRIAAPWHIYWLNPGDSGLRTKLSFEATGVELGPVVYPAPDRFVASGGQVSYGWEREAVLFVPLTNVTDEAVLEVRSDWLACHESCIPGRSDASAEISKLVMRDEAIVRSMIERIPEPAGDRLRLAWTDAKLRVEPTFAGARILAFFPYASDKAVLQSTALGEHALDIAYRFDGPPPAELGQGVIHLHSAGETRWLEIKAPWPSL